MEKSLLILFILFITLCNASRPQFLFYAEPGCVGDGLILGSKQPDLASFLPSIISRSQSFISIGYWGLYHTINYSPSTDSEVTHFASWECMNYTGQQQAKSARYLGPQDTTTPSISLYEITLNRGREVTITGPASNNIPFTPQSLFTTGETSWTLYNGSNFDGPTTCFIPRKGHWYHRLDELNSTLSNIRSVLRGCDRHIDYYIYGNGDNQKKPYLHINSTLSC